MTEPEKQYRILVINPGSTSTKVSLFANETLVFEHSLFHDAPELLRFPHVNDQLPFRYQVILDMLSRHGIAPESIDVYVGRGGSAYSQPGGVTKVPGPNSKVQGVFPKPQMSNSWTPAGCSTIQLNPDTIYLEVVSDSTG